MSFLRDIITWALLIFIIWGGIVIYQEYQQPDNGVIEHENLTNDSIALYYKGQLIFLTQEEVENIGLALFQGRLTT